MSLTGPRETRQSRLNSLSIQDPVVIVLVDSMSSGAMSNAKGHLFEQFVAHLLAIYGYENPTFSNLNVTANGIEVDVMTRHGITNQPVVAECKAYSSPVGVELLKTFYGTLVSRRFQEPDTHGIFVALPRLTAEGREWEQLVRANDSRFRVLSAASVVSALEERGEVCAVPIACPLSSDRAVLISEHGVYAACIELDEASRTPSRVQAWSPDRPVPVAVIELLAAHKYAQGVPVYDARAVLGVAQPLTGSPEQSAGVIVPVVGSRFDFEYQLPASPRFFVGRKRSVTAFEDVLATSKAIVILNAQSGWGKSSLALRLEKSVSERGGYALIVDSRTASTPRFVTEVLRQASINAQAHGLLALPADATWASLTSALRTLANVEWESSAPFLVFFDQFENVFRDSALTQEFRDLAIGVQELGGRAVIGFAWKTDLVGWTEAHPYRLRDEIRANAEVLTLDPFGPAEVGVLLRRLEKALGQRMSQVLRQRLREYSQGLPWLLKKLADHLIREVRQGATQEQLLSERLNVQNLFDADLAELGPVEQEALKHVARFAPIAIGEVLERVQAPIVQSLLDRRLLVQVGERLDTYWDIFRDYLNTRRVPVEDSYILRQSPKSVARLLREISQHDGDAFVPELAAALNTSENAVFNLSRELRQLGVAGLEPNRVRLISDIWQADNREGALRQRVAASLRRHRAYSSFTALAERSGGRVTLAGYARDLPNASPAVSVSEKTWLGYARAFLQWFEYAGLVTRRGSQWIVDTDSSEGSGSILGVRLPNRLRRGTFAHEPVGPSIALLRRLSALSDSTLHGPLDAPTRKAARPLLLLEAVAPTVDQGVELTKADLMIDGRVSPLGLRELIQSDPSGRVGLALLQENPAATPMMVGETLQEALGADWEVSTIRSVGKHFRSWARASGVETRSAPRQSHSNHHPDQLSLLPD